MGALCESLRAHLDGETGWLQAQRMRRHLRACAACRAALSEHARLDTVLAEAAGVAPPEGLLDTWRAGIPVSNEAAAERRRRLVVRRLMWAGACVAGVAALLALMPLLPGGHSPAMAAGRVLEMAAVRLGRARQVHVLMHGKGQVGSASGRIVPADCRTELWIAGPDRCREETAYAWTDEAGAHTMSTVRVTNGDRRWDYTSSDNRVFYTEGPSHRVPVARQVLDPRRQIEQALADYRAGRASVTVDEARGPGGEPVAQVVVQPRRLGDDGETFRRIFTVALPTNRLVGCERQVLSDGAWITDNQYDAVDYEAPMAAGLFVFQPPAGAKVIANTWWKSRLTRALAHHTLGDWDVIVHSLEVRQDGEVLLSISRRHTGASVHPSSTVGPWPVCRLTDQTGRPYAQFPGRGSWQYADGRLLNVLTFVPVDEKPLGAARPAHFRLVVDNCWPLRDAAQGKPDKPISSCTLRFDGLPAAYLPVGVDGQGMPSGDPEIDAVVRKADEEGRREALALWKKG